MGGVRIEWQTALVNLHADWTHDVSGNSKGQQIALAADRSWRIGDSVTPHSTFGLTWHDDKYTDIITRTCGEARAGRPAIRARRGLTLKSACERFTRLTRTMPLVRRPGDASVDRDGD
ncbi:hypothetical protein CEQ31_025940 [Serratia odorifera]|uniref:MipA/OmpV family protein n=1 Tax=Serratia odorifera TaxID=618 RepID=UPI000B4E20DF|nr:hypothetical protein CEQ31_025940 [Serratia odorifera]